MRSFLFAAGQRIQHENFANIQLFVEQYQDFSDITVKNEYQLAILLRLMGCALPRKKALQSSEDFEAIYDISAQKIREFTKEQFDDFYHSWLQETEREDTQDEREQLRFVLGYGRYWNLRKHRFILQARH